MTPSRSAVAVHALAATLLFAPALAGQQVADSAFAPDLGPPTFAAGRGPRVAIDAAHLEFHTAEGRYLTFARLLRRDGYLVKGFTAPFTADALRDVDVLVVANALAERNRLANDWTLPTPSAFTDDEVRVVRAWVEGGGALLLVADHMPFPGAADALARAFGFRFENGFAVEGDPDDADGPMVFRRADGSLGAHPVTDGAAGDAATRVDSVATFTGSAFRAPEGAVSLLTFRPGTVSVNPDTSWVFRDTTPRVAVGGWSQGAVLGVGRGRVAVFGEAAMFSAQRAGPQRAPMGMNAPIAGENPRFLLNLMHWLHSEAR